MKQPFRWTDLQQTFRTPLNTQDPDFLQKSGELFGLTLQKFQDQQNFLEFSKTEKLTANELKFGFHLASLLVPWYDLGEFLKLGQGENSRITLWSIGELSKRLVLVLDALAAEEIKKN